LKIEKFLNSAHNWTKFLADSGERAWVRGDLAKGFIRIRSIYKGKAIIEF